MARFLVTGGAGFIGSHIAEELIKDGSNEVVIFDDLSSGSERNISHLKGRSRFIKGDIRDAGAVLRSMKDIEIVFHNAAFVSAFDSYNKPAHTNEVNIGGTYNVLDAANRAGAKRVVLASSAAVYGPEADVPNREDMLPRPESPYAVAKACNEYHARMFSRHKGLETVCLRYFNVYGPRQDPSSEYSGVISRFVDAIKAGKNPVIFGDGTQTRDFIFVKDVAALNIKAAFSEECGRGEVINIGTGTETNLLQVIASLKHVLKKDVDVIFEPWRDGDIRRSVALTDLARSMLGANRTADFTTGIEATLA